MLNQAFFDNYLVLTLPSLNLHDHTKFTYCFALIFTIKQLSSLRILSFSSKNVAQQTKTNDFPTSPLSLTTSPLLKLVSTDSSLLHQLFLTPTVLVFSLLHRHYYYPLFDFDRHWCPSLVLSTLTAFDKEIKLYLQLVQRLLPVNIH